MSNGALLEMGMGTGKTLVSAALIQNCNFKRTLVIAPLSVVNTVWAKEIAKTLTKPIRVLSLGDKAGSVANKSDLAKEAIRHADQTDTPLVIVINYASVWREPFGDWALNAGFDCVIFDESHKIKLHSGKAATYCAKLGKSIKYRLALTGTPMANGPLDVFSQYRAIDPTIFGTSWYAFKNRYSIPDTMFPQAVKKDRSGKPMYINQDDLRERFYSIAYGVGKDVLDLPEVQHIERTCVLSADARKVYTQIEDDFISKVEEGEVTIANALVQLLRLAQITSGYIKTDEGIEVHIDDGKKDLLEDLLDDLDTNEPVVVFCRFHHDLDTVKEVTEKLGRRYAELSGRKNTKGHDLDAWQTGDCDVLAVQMQSGGVGIDLTRAAYCVYYSIGYSLGDYDQSLSRTHRPGQTRKVIYYHLLAESTVDEDVYAALEMKQDIVSNILGRIREKGKLGVC